MDDLRALLPHRPPMLLLDRVVEVVPGERGVAEKTFPEGDRAFEGHFPGRPILPGVFLVEAFAQLAAVVALAAHPEQVGRPIYLLGVDGVRFRRPVVPGDRVVLSCRRLAVRRGVWSFEAQAEVGGVRVAEGRVLATIAEG